MTHQLTGLGTGRSQTHTIHNVIQAALQQGEQILTGGAGHLLSQLEVVIELTLQHTVVTLSNLLGTQLLTVLGSLLHTGLAMLAGSVRTAVQGALASVAALALQEQFLTFTAAEFAHRTSISCHINIPPINQTRRRLGGRQPL